MVHNNAKNTDRHTNIPNNIHNTIHIHLKEVIRMDTQMNILTEIHTKQIQIMEIALETMQRFKDQPNVMVDMSKIIINAYNTLELIRQLIEKQQRQKQTTT